MLVDIERRAPICDCYAAKNLRLWNTVMDLVPMPDFAAALAAFSPKEPTTLETRVLLAISDNDFNDQTACPKGAHQRPHEKQ